MSVCACMCVHMSALCAWARVCLCVIGKGFWACTCLCGCVCALVCGECLWRPEVNMGCLRLFFTSCFVFVCAWVWSRVCQSECVQIRGQSGLLPCGLLEFLHSGHQAWWQGPSPTELSHFSSTLHFWDKSLVRNLELAGSARLAGQWVSRALLWRESRCISQCFAFYAVLGTWLRSLPEPPHSPIRLCLNYWAHPAAEVNMDSTNCPCWQ